MHMLDTPTIIALLVMLGTIMVAVLRMVWMLGGSLARLEDHDRRIGRLEAQQDYGREHRVVR